MLEKSSVALLLGAVARRAAHGLPDGETNALRVAHGEADGLAGVAVEEAPVPRRGDESDESEESEEEAVEATEGGWGGAQPSTLSGNPVRVSACLS